MSRFDKRKVQWDDDALDSLLSTVENMGAAVEALEQEIEELKAEDREMTGAQGELAQALLLLVRNTNTQSGEAKK